MKKLSFIVATIMIVLALSACSDKKVGNEENEKDQAATYPVTIQNFAKPDGGANWQEKDQIFDQAPERIMANTRPAAELLLHLGLADKIVGVGANFGAPDQEVEEAYAKLNILSDSYVGKEVTLGTDPDLVFGRGGLFESADWGVGTVDELNEMGIHTYVLASSVTGGTYDSIYEDIKNLGEIFQVQEQAEEFTAKLKERQNTILTNLEEIQEEKSFAYLHMGSDDKDVSIYPAHGETFFSDVFKMVKLDNIFKDETGEVSVEALIEADPDVLIVPDWKSYDGTDATDLIASLYENEKLSSMQAIQNKQIYAVDYNYMFGYGYIAIDGMEKLAKEMYPNLFE